MKPMTIMQEDILTKFRVYLDDINKKNRESWQKKYIGVQPDGPNTASK
jgi:hypothetical protein